MASDTGGPRTLIVKGLGPEATEESFGSFFSDLGPVLRSFLVRQGKGGPHKGFGFVQYALPEDAKRAVAKLDGKRLDGQRLKVLAGVLLLRLRSRWRRTGADALDVVVSYKGGAIIFAIWDPQDCPTYLATSLFN